MSRSWFAAFAPPIVGLSSPAPSNIVMANASLYTSALLTADAIALYSSISFLSIFLTRVTSAPCLLKNAAASNVRGPDLLLKPSVSIDIPAYSASASNAFNLIPSSTYCIISVTISQAEDAYGSTYERTAPVIVSLERLWWSNTIVVLHLSRSDGHSVLCARFASTTMTTVDGLR